MRATDTRRFRRGGGRLRSSAPVGLYVALFGGLFAGALLVPAALATDLQAQSQEADRSILLTVLDRQGAAIRDLTAADFAVTEGGEARTVIRAALSTEPLYVVIVVDTTQPPGQVRQVLDVRDALSSFVATLRNANPDGGVALIVSAGSALATTGFTAAPDELDRMLGQLAPAVQVESSVIEAIRNAGRMLGGAPGLRRAIVSVDLDSVDPTGVTAEEAATAVERSGAAVWAVSIRVSGRASPRRESLLNYLTPRTGGQRETLILSRPLEDRLRRMARTLTSQYVVTYRRPADAANAAIVPSVRRGARILMSPWIR
ncbi:MAG: hypothetical protein R2752_11025 [Vicinamibacterales bacterium]